MLALLDDRYCKWTEHQVHAAKQGHAAIHTNKHILNNRRLHLSTRLTCITCIAWKSGSYKHPKRGNPYGHPWQSLGDYATSSMPGHSAPGHRHMITALRKPSSTPLVQPQTSLPPAAQAR